MRGAYRIRVEPRTTVSGYLEILEETQLCFRIPAYEGRLGVRERKLPKWYWCDPGIVRAMKRVSGGLAPEERGALFEGLVAQVIRAYRDYRGKGWYRGFAIPRLCRSAGRRLPLGGLLRITF